MRITQVIYSIALLLIASSCQESTRHDTAQFDPAYRAQIKEEAQAFMRMSEIHFKTGYKKYGLENLKHAFIKDPYDQKSFEKVTNLLIEAKDWATLQDFYNYAIAKYGANAILYRNVGICQYRLDEYHEAVNSFKNAIALESTNPTNYEYLADTYEKLNKPEDALSTWNLMKIIVERLPDLPDAEKFKEKAEINIERLERSMNLPVTPVR